MKPTVNLDPEFIVAEVSKNWVVPSQCPDRPQDNYPPDGKPFLCSQFENVINYNRGRGYRLHSFQLHRVMTGDGVMNETIVAVFQRIGPKEIAGLES